MTTWPGLIYFIVLNWLFQQNKRKFFWKPHLCHYVIICVIENADNGKLWKAKCRSVPTLAIKGLKWELHLKPNWSMFCVLSQNCWHCLKNKTKQNKTKTKTKTSILKQIAWETQKWQHGWQQHLYIHEKIPLGYSLISVSVCISISLYIMEETHITDFFFFFQIICLELVRYWHMSLDWIMYHRIEIASETQYSNKQMLDISSLCVNLVLDNNRVWYVMTVRRMLKSVVNTFLMAMAREAKNLWHTLGFNKF